MAKIGQLKLNFFRLTILTTFLITLTVCYIEDEDLVKPIKDYPYDLNKFKMYSGYLDIESSNTKKLHYLFLESQNDPGKDPLFIWLNGGPGCSSLLFGFGSEHGPVIFNEKTEKLEINNFSWNKNANIIYLESPAGVGFSKGATIEDKTHDDVSSGKDNLKTL